MLIVEQQPRNIRLHNISFDEIGPFYDSLTGEKEFIGNPLRFPIEFVTGIRVNGELVAIGGLNKPRFGFIRLAFLIVKADFQGRGLSRDLKADIANYARERGYSFYMSEVWKDNPALEIFKRQGDVVVYKGDVCTLAYPLTRKGELIVKSLPLVLYVGVPAKRLISKALFFRRESTAVSDDVEKLPEGKMDILYCDRLKTLGKATESIHIHEVLSNLSKLGHNVESVDSGDPNAEPMGEPLFKAQPSPVERGESTLLRLRAIQAFKGEISIFLSFLREIRVFLLACMMMVRRRRKFDVIYRRHSRFNSDYLLAKLFRIPSVKEVNALLAQEAKSRRWGSRLSLRIFDRIERFNMSRADRIIVVTSRLKEVLMDDYGIPGDKIVVIPNGANVDIFKPMDAARARDELDLEQRGGLVCFVGALSQWQGIENLIRSAVFTLKQCPDTRFLIVGDGPIKESVVQLAGRLGVSQKVVFTGMVPYKKVPLYINASDICMAPLAGDRNERSGCSPLKMGEYLACGKPVVASRFPGLEFIEEHDVGLLVIPGNPMELAQATIRLIQDGDLRERMGENGRRYVMDHQSWESVAKRVAEACMEAVATKNHSPTYSAVSSS